MTHELHIDLLRCERCNRHNKVLDFCSACGHIRTKYIIAASYKWREDEQLRRHCRVCQSQSSVAGRCPYCNVDMRKNKYIIGAPLVFPMHPGFLYVPCNRQDEPLATRPILLSNGIPHIENGSPSSAVRTNVFRRDGGCLRCRTFTDLTLHHITHRSKGGSNRSSNLQALCEPCHVYVHNVLELPSGTPYDPQKDPNRVLAEPTQENEDAHWNHIRNLRARKHGKKDHHYDYGKKLATNMAAPMIARLRREAAKE